MEEWVQRCEPAEFGAKKKQLGFTEWICDIPEAVKDTVQANQQKQARLHRY